jgi:hypothetical protein
MTREMARHQMAVLEVFAGFKLTTLVVIGDKKKIRTGR